ncbi:MAG: B-box zinc finger protein [Methanoregula sp.]|jgi:uncharacterized membrane protein YvbJ|uniref:B-box zinc finger protein n=1 Tax=Methanoregula sp. TaxID=2052170 RepID=UPI003D13EC03
MKCQNHPDKEVKGACVGCGNFFCEDCLTQIHGKNYCKKCIVELAEKTTQERANPPAAQPIIIQQNQQQQQQQQQKPKKDSEWGTVILVCCILLFIFFLIGWGMSHH